MREFIHQQNSRSAFQRAIEIQLFDIRAFITFDSRCKNLQVAEQRLGFLASVSDNATGHYVNTIAQQLSG